MRSAERTKSSQPEKSSLEIVRIVRHPQYQFRPVDHGTMKRYASAMELGVEFPPVRVGDLNDTLVLIDGWHRVGAAESIGRHEIEAVVEPVASERELHWLAAEANVANGLPLKPRDHRRVFKAYVSAGKHRKPNGNYKSYREIAAELGGARAYTTIRHWMCKDFYSAFRAMGGAPGHPEPSPSDAQAQAPGGSLVGVVIDALQDARAAMPGVKDVYDRGEIVEHLQEILREAQSVPWKSPAEDPTRF
ncbi:MAG TPA: hypothetical protein VG328_20450 [Stellaceae bacterium]|jgi:hypothetical protein|nr:hypothetical protein [Stellaceae bacterium]